MATNEKIKLEIESTATGKGFEKVQKDAQKTKQVIGDLGKGVKNLGSIFGSIGGKLGNAFDSILKGGFLGAITFGIQALVEKWQNYKKSLEEVEKKTDDALVEHGKKQIDEYCKSVDNTAKAWKDSVDAMNEVMQYQDKLYSAQDKLTDATRKYNEELLKGQEARDKASAKTDEEKARVNTRWENFWKNLKSEQESEDSLIVAERQRNKIKDLEAQKALLEQERTRLEYKRSEAYAEAEAHRQKGRDAGVMRSPARQKQIEKQYNQQAEEMEKKAEKSLEDGLKQLTERAKQIDKQIAIEKINEKTLDVRFNTTAQKYKNTQEDIGRSSITTEDDIARQSAIERLNQLQKDVAGTSSYASQSANAFNPERGDYLTRTGTFNFGAYNSAMKIDQQLDKQSTQATNLEGTLQRFIDSKQAEKMSVEELLKVIEQYTAQNKELNKQIQNTAERAKRIQ